MVDRISKVEDMAKHKPKPTWREMKFCMIDVNSGADSISGTGNWRYQRPLIQKEKCNKCALCWLYCPDCSMEPFDDGYFEVDLFYCKGCGICAEVCPRKAIVMMEERV